MYDKVLHVKRQKPQKRRYYMAFNSVGFFTISSGASFELDGWCFGNCSDQGAQYFSANPLNPDAELISFDQSKTLLEGGGVSYGFSVRNDGPFATNFNVQGGGYS
jgi:hypothetical protein